MNEYLPKTVEEVIYDLYKVDNIPSYSLGDAISRHFKDRYRDIIDVVDDSSIEYGIINAAPYGIAYLLKLIFDSTARKHGGRLHLYNKRDLFIINFTWFSDKVFEESSIERLVSIADYSCAGLCMCDEKHYVEIALRITKTNVYKIYAIERNPLVTPMSLLALLAPEELP